MLIQYTEQIQYCSNETHTCICNELVSSRCQAVERSAVVLRVRNRDQIANFAMVMRFRSPKQQQCMDALVSHTCVLSAYARTCSACEIAAPQQLSKWLGYVGLTLSHRTILERGRTTATSGKAWRIGHFGCVQSNIWCVCTAIYDTNSS